ncbi:TPA: hypothetical protein N2A14_002570 [Pseudomonas aeruginosa]|nr:hypothetical protein [Pseudomonas aeruginosa]
MLSKPLKSFFYSITLLACVSSVFASEANVARTRLIVQTVMNSESGYVNKDLHDELWRITKAEVGNDPYSVTKVAEALQQVRERSNGYSFETWKSVKLSFEQRKVVRTPGFVSMSSSMRTRGPETSAAVDSAESALAAAANRKPITANGQTVYINQELIERVLGGIEAAQSRLDRLLTQEWSEEMHEQNISAAKVTILTPDLFTVSSQKIDGLEIPAVSAQRNYGPNASESIYYMRAPGAGMADLTKRAQLACNGAFSSIGLTCRASATQWRGRQGLTAAESTSVNGKPVGMAITILKRDQEHALQGFSVITPGSAADASLALDELMERVKAED